MLPSELKKALSTLQSALDSHEKIALAFFSEKLHKTSAHYPEDQTIGQMALVVDKMNAGNRLFISRAEVKDLYKKLYSYNTKFANLFAEELGVEAAEEAAPSKTEEQYQEFDIYQGTDKTLLAGLTSAFDPTATVFSASASKDAENTVAMECGFPGMVPAVKSISGDANCVVVQATYQTPKGSATFYVPVEMSNEKAIQPSYFMGRDGSHFISKASISSYVSKFFNKSGSFGNDAVGEALLETLEPEVSAEEVEKFASQLSSAKGIAKFQHGEKAEQGRRVISQRMNGFGKKSHQVNILDASVDSITYGVKCDTVAFKVPVKIEAGRLQEPTVLLCKGSIQAFSSEGINELEKMEMTDNQVAAVVSPLHDLRPSDLVETVRQAASEENYAKAEDALNVLEHMGDEKAYQVAFAEYTDCLSGVKKEAAASRCTRIIKSATSTQPMCAHLNLPIHKVYQDKHNECLPLSRKAQDDSNVGAYFMNSKILL